MRARKKEHSQCRQQREDQEARGGTRGIVREDQRTRLGNAARKDTHGSNTGRTPFGAGGSTGPDVGGLLRGKCHDALNERCSWHLVRNRVPGSRRRLAVAKRNRESAVLSSWKPGDEHIGPSTCHESCTIRRMQIPESRAWAAYICSGNVCRGRSGVPTYLGEMTQHSPCSQPQGA